MISGLAHVAHVAHGKMKTPLKNKFLRDVISSQKSFSRGGLFFFLRAYLLILFNLLSIFGDNPPECREKKVAHEIWANRGQTWAEWATFARVEHGQKGATSHCFPLSLHTKIPRDQTI